MTLDPILSASPVIQLHAAAALVALGLGPLALYVKRHDWLHKLVGYVWMAAISCAAVSSFFIHSFGLLGPFSPIHLLAVLALWSVFAATRAAIRGEITRHREILGSLYWHGLIIAGLFNFLPGRVSNRMFFEEEEHLGWVVIGLGGALILADVVRKRRLRVTRSKRAEFLPLR